MATGNMLKSLNGHTDSVNSVDFSPDNSLLASGSSDKTIKVWDIATGNLLKSLSGHSDRINSVVFSPDGKLLASGSSNKTFKLWDFQSGKLVYSSNPLEGSVGSLSFSPDAKFLASGSFERVRLWKVPSGESIACLFDKETLEEGKEIREFATKNRRGELTIHTVPCDASIPFGATCLCNCISGSYRETKKDSDGGSGKGFSYCSCDKICTCVPIK